jgi:hypothetical protein
MFRGAAGAGPRRTNRRQLAVTQNLAKASFPWAKVFIHRKYGIWCFERLEDAQAVKPGEMPPSPPERRKPQSV